MVAGEEAAVVVVELEYGPEPEPVEADPVAAAVPVAPVAPVAVGVAVANEIQEV